MDNNNTQAIMGALGYPMALPQGVTGPYTTNKTQVQRVQYDPNKMQALVDALRKPEQTQQGSWELLGNALAKNLTSPTYEGAYGVKFTNGKTDALVRGANMFNDIYGTQKQQERDAENAKRENEVKIAQMLADASKQAITDTTDQQYFKVNTNANGGTPEQQAQQKEAALNALKELQELSKGGIGGWNNEADSRWNSPETARKLGRREQALSALIPMTNSIAKASGGSGINTLGEMMAYLGVPENATSKQIEGVLPGLVKKLGLEEEFYGISKVPDGFYSQPVVVDGYTIKIKQ